VTPVNDAPSISGLTTSSPYTESAADDSISPIKLVLDPSLFLDDVDSVGFTGATVTISNNYHDGEDYLGMSQTWINDNPATAITYSFSAGVLTLSGNASVGDYEDALKNIVYWNTSNTPMTDVRTIEYVVDDAGVFSPVVSKTITVNAINDVPTLSVNTTDISYVEDVTGSIAVNDAIVLSDRDDTLLQSATVSIDNGHLIQEDDLFLNTVTLSGVAGVSSVETLITDLSWRITFDDSNQIVATYDDSTGVMGLVGNATLAQYQTVMRHVYYKNIAIEPNHGSLSKTIKYTVTDSNGGVSVTAQNLINIALTNDAPSVTTTSSFTFPETSGALTIDSNLNIVDVDSTNLGSAIIKINANYVDGEDFLSMDPSWISATIITSFNQTNGELTLSGVDSVANYITALQAVQYQNTSANPLGTKTIDFTVTDSEGVNSKTSAIESVTVSFNATNNPPVITKGHSNTLSYVESDGSIGTAIVIDNTITLSDADDSNLESAQVSILNFKLGDRLTVDVTGTSITTTFNTSTGLLSLSGSDSIANYQAVLRSVKYYNLSNDPSDDNRTIRLSVNDGDTNSSAVNYTLNFTATNDAPQISTSSGSHTLTYTENTLLTLNSSLLFDDVDSDNMVSATVTISGNYVQGEDNLVVDWDNTHPLYSKLSVDFDNTTGVLTIETIDNVNNPVDIVGYQDVLRLVKYQNLSDNPTTTARVIQFQVNDGESANNLSNTFDITVNITPVNDAPVVTLPVNYTTPGIAYVENGAPIVIGAINLSDVDSSHLSSATVGISNGHEPDEDQLSFDEANSNGVTVTVLIPNSSWTLTFADMSTLTASYDAISGGMTLSGNNTVANYQSAIASMVYYNTSDNPAQTVKQIQYVITDANSLDSANNVKSLLTITTV
ncbi:hypothetical protein, partial [Fastidiosibacter lacustris]|uniref:hypothetical protein n=1 Tax=Fastidiosibacter lacustris TaxID=2056695 RepID=UPI00195700D9